MLPFLLIAAATCTIPVEVYRNTIWIQVKVNGSAPQSFLLDSAAGRSVVARPTAEKLGMQIIEMGEQANATPSEKPVRMAASPNVEFDIGGAKFTTHAAVIGMEVPDAIYGRRMEGVLGGDFLSKFVVELDWEQRVMKLYDPAGYKYSGTGQTLPILFTGKNPSIRGRVRLGGKTVEGNLLIDSGAASTLALSAPLVEEQGLLKAVEAAGGRLIEGETVGAGGGAANASTRAEWLEIGTYRIAGPLTALSKAKSGSMAKGGFDGYIGCNVLRRFRVILDFGRLQATFEPNAQLGDPDEADGTGMRIWARGADLRSYYVRSVVPGSPAQEAGVQAGDALVSIGSEAAGSLTMEQIGRKTRGSGALALVFDRAGEKRDVRLVMRPQL